MRAKQMLSEDSLTSVFHRFKKDGEVHKESLPSALIFLGFHPVVELINDVAQKVSKYSTVDPGEFFKIVQHYVERRLIDQRLAFSGADKDGSGTLDMPEMSALLLQLGMKPMDFVVKGIFDEVDEDKSGAIDADEFDEFWRIMESREGFSKVEYNRLMGAFDIFDSDHSGTLDLEETSKALHYLHYTLSSAEAEGIFRSIDVSNLGHLCKREFLLFMRNIREHEVGKISECLAQVVDYTKEGTLTKLLTTLGHVPDRNTVIQCAEDAGIDLTDEPRASELSVRRSFSSNPLRGSGAESCPVRRLKIPVVGTSAEPSKRRPRNSTGTTMTYAQTEPTPGTAPALEVSSGEAWMFLELYRAREGLTREELHNYQEAFARVMGAEVESFRGDDDSIEITHHQTWMALRWLGWRVPKEVQQHLIGLVDLDSSGCLNLKEFLKLMRLVREREDEELHEARRAMGLPFADLFEVVHVDTAKRMLSDMGFPESADIRATLRALGIKPEQGAPKYLGPRSFEFSVKVERRLDWISLIRVVRYLRSEERADRRKFFGFTQEEVEKWTVIFSQCANKQVVIKDDGERELQSSTLRTNVFLRLLEEDYAPALFHGVDLRDIQDRLLALEVAADHGMDVKGFLKMMSEVHEDADVRYHRKLQRAEESCRFSAQEVREFQTIFMKWDTQEAGILPFNQVVEIVNGLTPLKAIHVAELYAIWEEVVSALDTESIAPGPVEIVARSPSSSRQLPQKPAHYSRLAAHSPGSTDFPEFLCIMECLIAVDFHDIMAKTARRISNVGNERRTFSSRRSLRRQAVFKMPEEDSFSRRASAAFEAAYPRSCRAEGSPAGFGLG